MPVIIILCCLYCPTTTLTPKLTNTLGWRMTIQWLMKEYIVGHKTTRLKCQSNHQCILGRFYSYIVPNNPRIKFREVWFAHLIVILCLASLTGCFNKMCRWGSMSTRSTHVLPRITHKNTVQQALNTHKNTVQQALNTYKNTVQQVLNTHKSSVQLS